MFQPLPHTTLSLPCPLRVHTSPVWLLHSPLRLLCHPVLACTTSSVWCHNHAAIPPVALTLPWHRDTLARASCHVVPLSRCLTHPRRCRHTRPREISSSCREVSKDGRVGSGCEETASMRTSTVRGKEGVWRYRSRVWLPRGVGRCRRCSRAGARRTMATGGSKGHGSMGSVGRLRCSATLPCRWAGTCNVKGWGRRHLGGGGTGWTHV